MAGFVSGSGFALAPALWNCQVLLGAAAGAVKVVRFCWEEQTVLLLSSDVTLGLILLVNDHGKNQVEIGWRLSAGGTLPSPSPGRIAAQGTVGVSLGKWPKTSQPNDISGIP